MSGVEDHILSRVSDWRLGDYLGFLLGWLPGGVVFPFSWRDSRRRFLADVCAFFPFRLLSPAYCNDLHAFRNSVRLPAHSVPAASNADSRTPSAVAAELARASRWLAAFQGRATVVPLVGAVLLVAFSGEMTLSFRLLVTSLIVLGMVGVGIAFAVTRKLTHIVRCARRHITRMMLDALQQFRFAGFISNIFFQKNWFSGHKPLPAAKKEWRGGEKL